MLETAVHWLVNFIETLGYPGVFLMSMLESTFLPIPSEATLIPAGYLIHQGAWNGPLVFGLAIAGTMTGSLLNYAIAYFCGRFMLVRYGKYMFMNEAKLIYMEQYFAKHGSISIFLGRFVFGVRHFISFPAGLAKMDVRKFSLYTAAGGGIWTLILLILGYLIGNNPEEVKTLLPVIKIGFVVAIAAFGFFYWKKHRAKAPQT